MAKKLDKSDRTSLKNHVTAHDTKTLQNVCKSEFGFGVDDLVAILDGDEAIARDLSEWAKKGRRASKYAPRIAEAILQGIDGTKSINLESAKILKAAGGAYTAIEKASNATVQANQKFLHDKELNALEYSLANEQEKKRHEYAKEYLKAKYFYDTYFMTVEEDDKLLQQAYRSELKQLVEDERYRDAKLDHLLTHGEDSDLQLVTKKDYIESDPQGSGILNTIKGFIGAIKDGTGW